MTTYADTLAALSDPTRRAVFERLLGGPRAVVDLADGLPVSRPAVSQHLRVLKRAGLVSDRHVGSRRLYQLKADGLAELRDYLDQFWEGALASFALAVHQQGEGDVDE